MTLEDMLGDLGCSVVGPAYNLADGLALAEAGDFDAALLDVNLGGQRSDQIADRLRQRGIPFGFITGYGAGAIGDSSQPVLSKPCSAASLAALLGELAR